MLVLMKTCGRSLFFGPPPAARLRETRYNFRRGTFRTGMLWDSASVC